MLAHVEIAWVCSLIAGNYTEEVDPSMAGRTFFRGVLRFYEPPSDGKSKVGGMRGSVVHSHFEVLLGTTTKNLFQLP